VSSLPRRRMKALIYEKPLDQPLKIPSTRFKAGTASSNALALWTMATC
jgi:hypothetical protein